MLSANTNGDGSITGGSNENGLGFLSYPPAGDFNGVAYGGYSWMFLMSLAVVGGYMQLHSTKGDTKKRYD